MERDRVAWPLAERAAPWLRHHGDEARAWADHLRSRGGLPDPAGAFAVRLTVAPDGAVALDPRVRLFPRRTGVAMPGGGALVMLTGDERGDRELHRLSTSGTLTPVRRLPAWAPEERVWCADAGEGAPGWVARWWAEPDALAPPETAEILACARGLARAWRALGERGVVALTLAHDGSGTLDGGFWTAEALATAAASGSDPYPGATATLRGLLAALDSDRELALYVDDPWSAGRTGVYRLPLEPDAPGRAAADPVRWRLGDAPLPTPIGWELRGAINALTRLRGEVRKGAAITLARRCLEEGYPALVPPVLRAAPRWAPPREEAVRLLLRAYFAEGHGGERIGAAYRALRETRRRLEGPEAEPEAATQALLRELLTTWRWGSGVAPPPGAPPVAADPDDPAWHEPSADSRRQLAAHLDAFFSGQARPRHDDDPGWVRDADNGERPGVSS